MPASRRPSVEIAVVPATEFSGRRRLLGALERAYAVRFTPFEEGTNPAAVIAFGVDPPKLRDVPTLFLTEAGQSGGNRTALEFLPDPLVPAPFRGRILVEQESVIRPLAAEEGATVLAQIGRDVIWDGASSKALVYRAGGAPPELRQGESLRDRLRSGRFFGLLPLVHFLQVVTGTAPSDLQACFVIDDPNLHALSYGHVSYPTLARHAEEHGYHVGMAMIPVDARLASRKAVSLFRAQKAQLSLLVHGNDHVRGELAQARSVAESTAVAAQALRRIGAFELRTGLRVPPIMVPPHGACSILGARGTLRAGFDALCTSPAPRVPEADVSLAGWHRAEFVAGGLPNISRHHLSDSPRDDLAFRAFLGQPLVLYLHHEDLRDGLDVLAEAVRDVAMCGAVRWMPVGDLAEMQFTMTVEGDTAFVRLFARRASVPLPHGVVRLVVEMPGHDEWWREILELKHDGRDQPVEAVFQDGRAEIDVPDTRDVRVALRHADTLAADTVSYPRIRPWPLLRRLLAEGRDRLAPTLRG
jgi:hypothetical protein